MQAPDAYLAAWKLRALRKLNHAKGPRRNEALLEDDLTKLAKWADLPEDDPARDKAFEAWLHSPLPSW